MTAHTQPAAWLERFVPRLWLGLADGVAEDAWAVLDTHGVVLVADIVGFTPLAIAHASQGRPGQATLSAVLDRCVALVGDETVACGGEPAGFAGDALFSLFTAADGGMAWAAARECARRILSAGRPEPKLRVGLAGGAVRLLCVRRSGRAYVLLLGAPVIAAARAQARARAGTMTIDPAHGPALPLPAAAPLAELVPDGSPDSVAALVPEPLAVRARAGQTTWLAEIRPVTSMFAALRDGGAALTAPPRIAQAIELADCALRAHGAGIDRVVQDEKGTIVKATVGLASDELADARADRAVGAALALRAALTGEGLAADIGVATGQAAVGAVGDERRRIFTIAGPSVNLAARLMQSAHGEVLVDTPTANDCRRTAFSAPVRLRLKGVAGEVSAAVASPSRRPVPAKAPSEMIGREAPLAALLAELSALRASGRPRPPVAVVGEPGIGKTTLLDAALRAARNRGVNTVTLTGDPLARTSPFGALAGMAPRAALAEQRDATLGLNPEHGHQMTLAAAATAFADTLGAGPLLLAVRDAHWIDEASLAVLEHVHRRRDRLLLVLESRPRPGEPLAQMLSRTRATTIELEGLGAAQIGALARRCLGVRALSPDVVDALTGRSGGNPFFAAQLALALAECGAIIRRGDVAQLLHRPAVESTADLPATIHDTLVGRIDRLDPHALLALKVASVFGLSAEVDAVRAAHPVPVTGDELRAVLDRLAVDGMIAYHEPDRIAFRHALHREATYALLTQPQRSAAHAAAARWLEAHGDPEASLDRLAYHWTQADDGARALPLLVRAARRSAQLWPGQATLEYVAAAQRFAARGEARIDGVQAGEWDLLAGIAYRGAGEPTRGDALILAGLARMGLALPRSQISRLGVLAGEAGRQLLTRLAPSRRIGRDRASREPLAVAVNAYRTLFIAAYQRDDLLQMGLVNARILNLVEAAGLREELPVQYGMAQLAAASTGVRPVARLYGRLARRAAAAEGSELSLAHARTYDAVYLLGEGRFVDAADQLAAATGCYALRLPGSYIHDVALSLAGYVDYFTARFARAIERYRSVHDSGVRRGDPGMVAWGCNGEAMCRLALGQDEAVLTLLERSRELPVERLGRIAWHAFAAVASVRLGRVEPAWRELEIVAPPLLTRTAAVAVLAPEYAALVETAHRLAACSCGERHHRAQRLAEDGLRRFARLQRRFPSARPVYLVALADARRAAGDRAGALRAYARAACAADRLAMPREAALAALGAARLRDDGPGATRAAAALARLDVDPSRPKGAT